MLISRTQDTTDLPQMRNVRSVDVNGKPVLKANMVEPTLWMMMVFAQNVGQKCKTKERRRDETEAING